MPREFPVVIRKNGEKFIPKFPIDLSEGDQFVIVKEMRSFQVPEDKKWTINGYTDLGPRISDKS